MEKKLTPQLLQQLHPECFWAVHRMGRQEALADPATKRQLAEEYLRNSHMEASSASPTARPEPSSSMKASPQPSGITISEEQEKINRLMGLSDETVEKYNQETRSQLSPLQAQVNKALNLSDETFMQYVNGR